MLHIAICDDERDFVQQLTELLNQYSKETGRDIKITAYYDGIELIEKYDPTIDLIFLDIQMKMVDGLHAAERIRQMDETVGIIFLTTLTQYGLEGYKYHATNYIIKPMKYVRLKSEMDKFVERSQKEDAPSLVITNDTGKYKVPLKSIRYVETYNRNLMFHTEQENIICYKSIPSTADGNTAGLLQRAHCRRRTCPLHLPRPEKPPACHGKQAEYSRNPADGRNTPLSNCRL